MRKAMTELVSASPIGPGSWWKGHPPASVAPAGGRTLGADRKVRPRNSQLCGRHPSPPPAWSG